MSDFDKAAEMVREKLEPWKAIGRGKGLRASRSRLEALKAPAKVSAKNAPPRTPAASPPVTEPSSDSVPNARPREKKADTAPLATSATARPGVRLSRVEKEKRLGALRDRVAGCVQCLHLAASRTQAVFGVGNPDAEIMFVGEAPGADEDLQGEPFVGRAGELLTRIISAMGFSREEVFIANVLKCRPDMPEGSTGNRKPRTAEMETCLPYLREQIDVIGPKVLVALGATAMEGLTGSVEPMAKLRGRWHEFQGIPLMATYHPAYLLRNQTLAEKRKVWEDMLKVLERLGIPITAKQRNYFLKNG